MFRFYFTQFLEIFILSLLFGRMLKTWFNSSTVLFDQYYSWTKGEFLFQSPNHSTHWALTVYPAGLLFTLLGDMSETKRESIFNFQRVFFTPPPTRDTRLMNTWTLMGTEHWRRSLEISSALWPYCDLAQITQPHVKPSCPHLKTKELA